MTITPELVAKLIFMVSNLRYYEREYENDPNWNKRDELLIARRRLDEFLIINGWYGYMSKEDIIKSLTEADNLKQAI